MDVLTPARQALQRIRAGEQTPQDFLFAPVIGADGAQSDSHEQARFRLLLALQCDLQDGDEALLAALTQAEIERHRMEAFQGLYPALSLAVALLARYQNIQHLPLMIDAKRANFDTHCGLDVQCLLSSGIEASYAALAQLDADYREAFTDYLGATAQQCKISQAELDKWRERQARRYPAQLRFAGLEQEIDFLLDLGETEAAKAAIARWQSSVFTETEQGWQALYSFQRSVGDTEAMIAAQQALLAYAQSPRDRASRLLDLGQLYLSQPDLPALLGCITELQAMQPEFKQWRKLGLGRFIAELYADYVLAAGPSDQSREVSRWAQSLVSGMNQLHWNLLEKLVRLHEQGGDARSADKYRLLLYKEQQEMKALGL
ncbi:hypothetical protein DZC30_00415 [Comamonas testosteroni]|uniref:Uncharacterized protein n=1 Tax=Comamonas testosteroni TaxID=285 RepID=A0A373FTZ8_COMTE|nr:hypothetical protein [Comamonas testosteroni]RGE46915.1 hypothetical protein DZC30_00415 [Comamonas testosteroni]